MAIILKNILITLLVLFGSTCGTKQPKVEDETQRDPELTLGHVNLTTNCAQCHDSEPNKPQLDKEESEPIAHGENQPCETCHTWPKFAKIKKEQADHDPKPKTCMGCHTRKQESSCHTAQGDCLPCHSTTAWNPPILKASLCK